MNTLKALPSFVDSTKNPARIGDTLCDIHCEVVEKNTPLLLRKASLKRANASFDLAKDKIVMLGQPIRDYIRWTLYQFT